MILFCFYSVRTQLFGFITGNVHVSIIYKLYLVFVSLRQSLSIDLSANALIFFSQLFAFVLIATLKCANEYSLVKLILTAPCNNRMSPTISAEVIQNCTISNIFPFNVLSKYKPYFFTISWRLLGTSDISSLFSQFSCSRNRVVDQISVSSINLSRWKPCIVGANKRFPLWQRLYDFPIKTGWWNHQQ